MVAAQLASWIVEHPVPDEPSEASNGYSSGCPSSVLGVFELLPRLRSMRCLTVWTTTSSCFYTTAGVIWFETVS